MNKEQHDVRMPSFLLFTLGCKLNQLESEAIIDAFTKAGFIHITENKRTEKNPSVVIVNTCTVTSKADQKARGVIRKTLREYPDSRVIVTGCYAQLNKDDILNLDHNQKQRLFVIGKEKILNLKSYLPELGIFETVNYQPSFYDLETSAQTFSFNPQTFSAHTRSFLKIQDGCDNQCTYCKIRLVRGKSVSLDPKEVLSRLQILEQNHAEAVLTGVNISQYCFSKNEEYLTELLDFLLSGTEKIAIRLSSLAPECVDEKLIKVLSHLRIRPHFHLSIQSCSEKILARMGRAYNSETIQRAVTLLRSAKDDPFLACDIIAGFPGETDNEFEETYSLCKKLDFAWIHVFPYSKREGTPAFLFTDNVKESIVTKRVQLLTDLAKEGRAAYVQRWLGREVDVLTENSSGEKEKSGTSDNYLKVKISTNDIFSNGSIVRCKLVQEGNFDDFDAIAHTMTNIK
ncbi:MAG: tRNA (N(6)-L-threonylcarbamoyladenosine(37)-C(2))-methylthiotransferase MtaB [Treponema sp.]|nr:tRNA (N(6)-L-threonylcarbamoyladenosine(37)-C(2))-methylthiotransferase MtaB [Treponema sp.]MCL2252012.1 tRNA (N(6)-L-threonylcarbamoyladenosine(37)-C(2))-methylthiotransferase MtaB [Treponema sp.]